MNLTNSIFDDLNRSSLLYTSLLGVRSLLEQELLLKDLIIASEDSASRELQRRLTDEKTRTIAYPYSYISMSELTGVKDRVPGKNVKRMGYRSGVDQATKATARKAFVFPVLVQLSLHYLDNDPLRTLRMAEALVILTQIGYMTFTLKSGNGNTMEVYVEIPDSATIPIAETENTHAPGSQEIEVPLVIHTWAGFFRDVSAVNSDRPNISFNIANTYLQNPGEADV